ncbi:FUN14 domain-containing protein 1 [Strongylocentrotus purpuratus]|uniref:FUN14 domain-containing protein 1 n=1 Tax=Strongylocentrotus purpuratus TaxID=7668 RepID=A0A7M7NL48_STRPU|nr:FUN14 domain-containing protein 1 [Strongylocentrotus purpuratus]
MDIGLKMATAVSKSTSDNAAATNDADDNFEILELAEAGKNWLERALDGELSKKSVPVQLAMGGTSGWVAGYLFQKVSKAAATAVGGGFMLVLVGHHTGYLKVNWKQFEKDISKTQQTAAKEVEKRYPAIQSTLNKGKDFCQEECDDLQWFRSRIPPWDGYVTNDIELFQWTSHLSCDSHQL